MNSYLITLAYMHPNAGHTTEKVRTQATTIIAAINVALRKVQQFHRENHTTSDRRAIRAMNETVVVTAMRFQPSTTERQP